MGSVEFLNPKGFLLLTGLVPLILFYILKVKRQRLRVPSVWLWNEARRDLLAKHPFKRLIPELALLLQILALAALSIALARPALRGGRITGDHVAIVIDTSASMGTLSHPASGKATTRMQEAIEAADNVLSAMEPGADAILIEGAREAKVISPLDRDLRRLKGSLSQVGVREVEGDLGPAVALAADRLRSLGGRRRIIIITDGALANPDPLAVAGMDTQLVTVGEAADNVGIVRIDVRAGVDPTSHKEQSQVFVMLQSFAATPKDVFVTLTVEGKTDPVASRRVLVPPKEKLPVVLTFEPSPMDFGKGLQAELSPHDALTLDDTAFGRVPQGRKMPVVHASPSEYSWVARALDSDQDVDVQKLTLGQLGNVNVDPEALIIVEGGCPESVPGLDVLIIGPPIGTCLGVDVGAVVEQPQVTSWEAGDPRFRFLTFDGVHVAKATPLKAPGGSSALLRAGTTNLIADASIPGRMVTILGYDVGETDWPLKASFVLFMRNVVELARLHRSQGTTGPARTGDPLRIPVPKDVTSIKIDGPGVPERDLAAKGGFAILPSVDRAGVYHARWTMPRYGSAVIVANLTAEHESDIRARPVAIDANAGVTSSTKVADAHHEWALWAALVALALIAFDIFWLTRRKNSPVLSTVGSTSPKLEKGKEA
ncbi:MAG TPA: BatA and WFA domain-containing protein [Polyangiaceae bacterium]